LIGALHFFFQAEDGIRDFHVTGVQTCALPISAAVFMGDTGSLALGGALGAIAVAAHHEIVLLLVGGLFVFEMASVIIQVFWFKQIGSAACRERGWIYAGTL